MFVLVVLVLFGIGGAYFATQNTQTASITLANYSYSGIPLYLIALGSLLVGFVVSWLISLVDGVSSYFRIHGKDSALKDAHKEVAELTKRVHQIELENERLRAESGHPADDKSL